MVMQLLNQSVQLKPNHHHQFQQNPNRKKTKNEIKHTDTHTHLNPILILNTICIRKNLNEKASKFFFAREITECHFKNPIEHKHILCFVVKY